MRAPRPPRHSPSGSAGAAGRRDRRNRKDDSHRLGTVPLRAVLGQPSPPPRELMKTTFYDLDVLTAPGRVFTPRKATERLVDAALERIDGVPMRVADVGTGSGAVAVALAVNRPHVEVWATDTNADAVELARANAERHGVADGVRTAFGRAGEKGIFWKTRADDMAVKVVRELLRRNPKVEPERIGDVIYA